ncbi:hypothetical protein COL60_30440 [Bacillus pseudomycoides]|nr:hypothetical protein COL60_30440 [Bacillus pseudomycoides]
MAMWRYPTSPRKKPSYAFSNRKNTSCKGCDGTSLRKGYLILSITFIEHKISPMGVPHIKGYINDNRELWFDAGLDDNDTFKRKLGRSGELGKLIKKPGKSVSEIKKEKKKKNKSSLCDYSCFLLEKNKIFKSFKQYIIIFLVKLTNIYFTHYVLKGRLKWIDKFV